VIASASLKAERQSKPRHHDAGAEGFKVRIHGAEVSKGRIVDVGANGSSPVRTFNAVVSPLVVAPTFCVSVTAQVHRKNALSNMPDERKEYNVARLLPY
jgi:hypothetical protein